MFKFLNLNVILKTEKKYFRKTLFSEITFFKIAIFLTKLTTPMRHKVTHVVSKNSCRVD